MRRLALLVAWLPIWAILPGCSTYPSDVARPTMALTSQQGAVAGRPALGMPEPVPGHPTVLIPFVLENHKGWFEASDPFARGGQAASAAAIHRTAYHPAAWDSSVRWHNAIIRDLKTGDEWPILSTRGVISRRQVFFQPVTEPTPAQPLLAAGMVFIATTADSNQDGAIDDRDANVAIVCNGDGRNPRVISPTAAQVWSVSFDPDRRLVFMYVLADTDGDGSFTPSDSPRPYVFELDSPGPARPVVSQAIAERVQSLLQ